MFRERKRERMREKEREKEGCLNSVRTYMPGTVLQGCSCLSSVTTYLLGTVLQGCSCLSGVATYLLGTVLQGCSCLSSVATYLPALCCSGAAVKVVSKPICRDSVAGSQLFKRCRNLSAGTVLQGCSCLSGVKTYLPALCCRGAAV